MGSVMSPVIVVIADDGNGRPALPSLLTIDGRRRGVSAGPAFDLGGYPARVVSLGDHDIVVQKIAAVSGNVLAVFWFPVITHDRAADWLARVTGTDLSALVVRQWACEVDPVTGAITSAALTAAGGAVPTAVKAAWPATWRLRTGAETPGVYGVSAPGLPLGVLCIGAVLAG